LFIASQYLPQARNAARSSHRNPRRYRAFHRGAVSKPLPLGEPVTASTLRKLHGASNAIIDAVIAARPPLTDIVLIFLTMKQGQSIVKRNIIS